MKYQKANLILPPQLLAELQEYLQGEYLYVPAKKDERKAWGECSGYREEIKERNRTIMVDYHTGLSIEEIAVKYSLSVFSIRKIVYHK
jgi:Mor family transcriptional regulator